MFLYSTVSTLKPIVGIVVTPYVWQQWTKPYFTPDRVPGARTHAYGLEMLGRMSKRDEYLLRRTRAFALASGLQRCSVHHGMNGATKTSAVSYPP